MTPTELWLPVGAAAFYVYDSCCLLWQNELMFTRDRSRWLVEGGTELRFAGRRLFVPNPLLPMRPQFQVCWTLNEERPATTDSNLHLLQALRPIDLINELQLLLLVALPFVAWTLGAGLFMLALFGLFYSFTLACLVMTWRRRGALNLPARAFWLLALDSIACAPFSVNLNRKLSMRHGIAGDPLRFAARNLDAGARDTTRSLVSARVQEEHADAEETERERRIGLLLSRLAS
jgi:hypothetical protein